jgi:transposase
MSSGGRITHRLSRRGNRQLNHALHIAAITQIRYPHSPGRAFFERKVAEGKTNKKPSAPSSGASPTPSTDSSSSTPAHRRDREGNRGRLFNPA